MLRMLNRVKYCPIIWSVSVASNLIANIEFRYDVKDSSVVRGEILLPTDN